MCSKLGVVRDGIKEMEKYCQSRRGIKVSICEQQYGFMTKKSTTGEVSVLRLLMRMCSEGQRELLCFCRSIENILQCAKTKLWCGTIWSPVWRRSVLEWSRTCIRAIGAMERCAVGVTKFKAEVGLHHGSDLSCLLLLWWWTGWKIRLDRNLHGLWWLQITLWFIGKSREQVEEI